MNTRRDVLRNALAFGGVTTIPDLAGRTGAGGLAGLSRNTAQRSLELRRKVTKDNDSIPLPPHVVPDPPDPVVDARPGSRLSAVEIDVSLDTLGAIVSAASPKLGADLSIDETGEYRITATQSVRGRSTHSRRGGGILVLLNFVYPRLCVENTTTSESCVNGFPQFYDPLPHARLYGLQLDDIVELFGTEILELIPWLGGAPDIVKHLLATLGEDVVESVFVDSPVRRTEEINRSFDIETTFVADASHDYRVWHCFDVVVWALGRPDVMGHDWVDVLNGSLEDAFPEWDGMVDNRLNVDCTVDDLTVERIGDAPPPSTTGRVLTVTKEGVPDGRGAFFIRTDDAIDQAVDSEAVIVGPTAIDWVGPNSGIDNLNLRGTVTDFIIKGEAAVYHDGQEAIPETFGRTTPNESGPLSNTLTVESTGTGLGAFGVTVSGELDHGADSEAVIRGRSALDWVGPEAGTDELRFSGEIRTLLLKGDAKVYLNGERIFPPIHRTVTAGGTAESHTLTVAKEDVEDGLAAFAVTATGGIRRTVESEAIIDDGTAIDWVGPHTGIDRLRFTGDIEQFLLKGTANVYLDGERTDPRRLGSDDAGGTDPQVDTLPNSLRVTKDGVEDGRCAFVVAVSGSITGGRDSETVIAGSYALDWVGPKKGTDELRYSGEITDLVLKGPAAVYRNGERM